MKPAYYNEWDKKAAAWLRELIRDGHIAAGDVDERSILDVHPDDLKPYGQCHFFAGIGGWSRALRLAGVPDDYPVWTGSAPCQPFSEAGAGRGFSDDRHLWDAFYWLIAQRSPRVVFGEQVDAAIRHGWLDLVRDDLEAQNYAFASICLPAACVGAPHIRQRLWWVAYAGGQRQQFDAELIGESFRVELGSPFRYDARGCRGPHPVADSGSTRLEVERQQQARGERTAAERDGAPGALADNHGCGQPRIGGGGQAGVAECGNAGLTGFWWRADRIVCRDGKARPVEPGIFPLVDGFPNRMGLLRGAGNAIVPQVAAAFVEETFLTLPSIHRIL